MRHRVEIQRPVKSTDSHGQANRTWESVATGVPAQVWADTGDETERSDHLESQIGWKIRTRYRGGINSTMRVVWGERTLNFRNVYDEDGGLRRYLIIEATEVE